MPRYNDSLDKIILTYFAGITKEKFTYKFNEVEPLPVMVQPSLFRILKCHPGCAACCPQFTLDYLPDEPRPDTAVLREVAFKDKKIPIYTDFQKKNVGYHCHFVNEDGYCKIHRMNPFSCDFETVRFMRYKTGRWGIINKIFGRAWNMKRIDHKRGALCTLSNITRSARPEIYRKFNRLKAWTDHFELDTHINEILRWIATNQLNMPFNSANQPLGR